GKLGRFGGSRHTFDKTGSKRRLYKVKNRISLYLQGFFGPDPPKASNYALFRSNAVTPGKLGRFGGSRHTFDKTGSKRRLYEVKNRKSLYLQGFLGPNPVKSGKIALV